MQTIYTHREKAKADINAKKPSFKSWACPDDPNITPRRRKAARERWKGRSWAML